MDVLRLFVKVGADIGDAIGGLSTVEAKAQTTAAKVGGSMTNIGKSTMAAGAGLTAGVTVPMVGMGVVIGKVFGDYERNASVFQATTSASTDEMEAMRKKAKDLGADMKLPGTSAGDAAAAMLELAKGGLSVQESMDGARGVLQLSAAAQIDNAAAATIVADALNTFGLAGGDATKVADLLAASANASTADINDMAYGFQMAGAVFASNKVPIDDLATSLAIMANSGMKGSDAGTSLKTMMMRLAAPTNEAASALKDLGVGIYNADGSMRPFSDIVSDLSGATKGLSDEQRNAALSTIFGTDAIRAATILTDAGAAGFEKMGKAVNKQGAAADLASAQNNGLLGAWDGLMSVVEGLGIAIGEAFGPYIIDALKTVGEWVNKLADWFEKLPAGVKKWIGIGLLVAAALGPALLIIGGLISMGGTLVTVLGFLVSPVGLVVAGIAAVVAGLVLLWAKSEGFRDFITSVWGALLPGLQKAWETLKQIISNVSEFIGGVIDSIKQWASENEGTINEWKDKIKTAAQELGEIIAGVMKIVERITAGIKKFWDTFGEDIMAIVGNFVSYAIDGISGLVTFISGIIDVIVGILTLDKDKIVGGLRKVVEGFLRVLIAPLKLAFENLKHVFGRVWDGIKSVGSGAVDWLKDRWNGFINFMKDLPGKIGNAAKGIWNGIKDAFKSALNWIIDKWNKLDFGFKVPDIPGIPNRGRKVDIVPDLPRLAMGAFAPSIAGGYGAVIGEGRHDEAVLPLSTSVFDRIGQGIARSGANVGGVHIDMHFNAPVNEASIPAIEQAVRTVFDEELGDILRGTNQMRG